jgi:hypothetical protein
MSFKIWQENASTPSKSSSETSSLRSFFQKNGGKWKFIACFVRKVNPRKSPNILKSSAWVGELEAGLSMKQSL